MRDIIVILGLIIGAILIIAGKKTKLQKYTTIAGILVIAVCLVIVMPDIINGFIDGYTEGIISN